MGSPLRGGVDRKGGSTPAPGRTVVGVSVDASTVAPHGGNETRTRAWRRTAVSLVVVATLVVAAALWWTQSAPQVVGGSEVGPSGGAERVAVTDPSADPDVEVYRQTRSEAWTAWSVRNDGRYAVTLTAGAPTNPGPNVMPRTTVHFLPSRPEGAGTPDGLMGATPVGLQDSVTIQPGEEGYVIGEVFFPAQCLSLGSDAPQGPTYTWMTTPVDARVLGRTSTLVLALPRRIATPTQPGTCPLEAFGGR